MSAPQLALTNVGPIKKAEISFGDLTVFVGAQATGKSIALQVLNYLIDAERVHDEMVRYGLDWGGGSGSFWSVYFGEGMGRIFMNKESQGALRSDTAPKKTLTKAPARRVNAPEPPLREEALFYIPAQRVLTLQNGWPRPFSDYAAQDPYVVKAFSERIRVLLDRGFDSARSAALFPQTGRLKGTLRDALQEAIFRDFELAISTATPQRRLVLRHGNTELPFMVWSSGQREFVPLLAGLYWLLPPTKVTRRGQVEWVVIEEPEMGLHPKAIAAVMLIVLELMHRGYRVCISTHSPQVLDVVWAIKRLKETASSPKLLLDAFDVKVTDRMKEVATSAFSKDYRTYFFGEDGLVRDISTLDPGAESEIEAGWGGLSAFSGRMADAVAEAVNLAERAA